MKRLILVILIIVLSEKTLPQWEWYNPYPTIYDLLEVQFVDENNGFLISENNEFLKTADRGQFWQYQKFSTQFIRGMSFLNKDIGYLCGVNGTILKTLNGGESWDTINTGFANDINAIKVVDNKVVYAVADSGAFLFSTDGGSNWERRVISFNSNEALKYLYFTNKDTGIVLQDNYIYRTTNGGNSWIFHEILNNWYRIDFPNDSVGYISGDDGKILKTTNAGASWIEIQTPINSTLRTLQFVNDSVGYFFGEEGIKTTDGGETWINLTDLSPYTLIFSQHFFDESSGMVVGEGGRIFTTTDGGQSWNIDHQRLTTTIYHLNFIDDSTAIFILGSNNIAKSSDYFKTWDVKLTAPHRIYDLSFPQQPYGYAVDSSKLYKTIDNGENWNSVSDFDGVFTIDFVNPLVGLAAGFHMHIYRTADGGNNWELVEEGTNNNISLWSIDMVDSTFGSAVGVYSKTYYTLNGGLSWFYLSLFPPTVHFIKVKFLKRTLGIACGFNGILYKSITGGASWFPKISSVDKNLRDIYFINEDSIYVVGDGGVILLSTDSGESWSELPSPTAKNLYAIDFPNPNLGFIAGQDGTILVYKNIPTSVDNFTVKDIVPEKFILYQNYPNPFNPSTKIKFKIPSKSPSPLQGEGFRVRLTTLEIYNVLGEKVTTLINKELPPGEYEIEFNGSGLPSGIYFYKLETNGYTETKAMVLIK